MCELDVEVTVMMNWTHDHQICFWDNDDFDIAQKSMSYEVQCAELEYNVRLVKIKNIKIVELV